MTRDYHYCFKCNNFDHILFPFHSITVFFTESLIQLWQMIIRTIFFQYTMFLWETFRCPMNICYLIFCDYKYFFVSNAILTCCTFFMDRLLLSEMIFGATFALGVCARVVLKSFSVIFLCWLLLFQCFPVHKSLRG